MKQNKFYKTSSHGGCGSTVMFWGINGGGYVTNIDEAHIYTHEEMQSEVSKEYYSGDTIPLSVNHVNELATWRVDCQYVSNDDCYPNKLDPNNEYVVYKKRCWDGNDLLFSSNLGESFDYSKARVYCEGDFDGFVTELIFISKSLVDVVARRTFQTNNINRRKMIQGAGIIGVRKPRKRTSTGKERWNCPTCGKIHWQFNPYDFDGRDDRFCNSYNDNKWDGFE